MSKQLQTGPEARFNEYPILEVLLELGIVPKDIDSGLVCSLDSPVLDVGCGRHANLVRHLSGYGFRTEGVDPEILDELVNKDYLMKQKANQIPRGDGYYGAAVSHMSLYQDGMIFPAFILPKEGEGNRLEAYKDFYRKNFRAELMATLEEIRRVLKPGSDFIIYPFPSLWFLEDGLRLKMRGYKFIQQDVPSILNPVPPGMEELGFEYFKRLVIKMPQ